MIDWQIILAIITGLIIFIYGIENFSKEILALAGSKFRQILAKVTKNRFSSTALGAGITAIIQSSSATTVITVSLVSAGLISFAQSLGIILGANIGTTITAQLVAFKITAIAPIFIIIGFLMSIFGKHYRYIGKGIFYFGLLFFGLLLISNAIVPLKTDPGVINLFSNLSNIFVALFVGLIFTAIVQSSSVTIGIVIVLAGGGLITLQQAIPLMLGANIGTTVTTFIASAKLNIFAKRSAVAHFMFKIIGAVILLPLIIPFANFIMSLGGSLTHQIANAHTIFNLSVAFVFVILLVPFQKLIEKLVPTKEHEILLKPKYIPEKLPESNKKCFDLIEKELSYSLEITNIMYEKAIKCIKDKSDKELSKIVKLETLTDLLDEKIEQSLLELSQRELNDKEANKVVLLVRISNAIEQLSDTAKDISVLPKSLMRVDVQFSDESFNQINKVYKRFDEAFDYLKKNFPYKSSVKAKQITDRTVVEELISKSYKKHVEKLKKERYHADSIFVESISLLEDGITKLREIIVLTREFDRIK
ncbi:Na/Pi cotransporter family protein [Nanoarchaeota archaeon]